MPALAINGGEALRRTPFPRWPIWDEEDEKSLVDTVRSGIWGSDREQGRVPEFTDKFCALQDAEYGVCCSSGTSALMIALRALGIGPGDEVIIPAYTFVATASAVLMVGATPIFADISPNTCTLDPDEIEKHLTPKTRAVIAVHVGGCPADLDAIRRVASKHHLFLIEDAAQAHGAVWNGKGVGAIGDIGIFSFQSSKNLTAGEGGIVLTNQKDLFETAWSLINAGRPREGNRYEHLIPGGNFRMTEFQGALLLSQMRRLKEHIALREENAFYLEKLLNDIPGIQPLERDPRVTTHARHLFIFRYDSNSFDGITRNRFLEALNAEGIPASCGYPPLYKTPAVAPVDQNVYCPVTEQISAFEAVWFTQNLLLGTHRDMEEIAEVIWKIREHASELKPV